MLFAVVRQGRVRLNRSAVDGNAMHSLALSVNGHLRTTAVHWTSVFRLPRFSINYLAFFLPLDEAIASRMIFVILSGSDGRKSFLGQLNNSKTVKIYGTMDGLPMSSSRSPRTPNSKSATTDSAHHVGSSSGLITIVAMTLLILCAKRESS